MSGGSEARPPRRWIRAQQTLLGATLLLADRGFGDIGAEREALEGKVWDHAYLPEDAVETYAAELRAMPTATLHALSLLADHLPRRSGWRDHVQYWRAALSYQQSPAVGERPCLLARIMAAKLLAERILAGAVTPLQLIRLARAELAVDWSPDRFADPLRELLHDLAATTLFKADRLAALDRFASRLEGVLPKDWALVENVVIEQSLAWPSLILASARHEHHHREWDLPVMVRIALGGAGDTHVVNADPSLLDTSEWKTSIETAREAFVQLWRYKHGAWDAAFIETVRNADVEVDFGLVAEIVGGFPELGLDLTGSSLESYFTLLFVGLVLDPRAMETVRSTGTLGEPIGNTDQDGGDHKVHQPKDVDKKIRLTLYSSVAEHLLVAAASSRAKSPKRFYSRGHLRVTDDSRCVSDMADLVFGQLWRKHRYERCPDIAFAFKAPLTGSESDARDDHVRWLAGNDDPVVRAPPGLSGRAVAAALKSIAGQASGDKKLGNPQARALSFAFVRTAQGESPENFWRVLFDVLGAPPSVFSRFLREASRDATGRAIADELNPRSPTLARPHRAPDVLVILGSDLLDEPRAAPDDGPFGRFQLRALLPALRRHLQAGPNPEHAAVLGATRIILVPVDEPPRRSANPWPALALDLQESLMRLSVFRFGFTREMARVLLRYPLNGGDWRNDKDFDDLFTRLLTSTHRPGEPVLGQPQSELEQRNGARAEHRATPSNLYFVRRPVAPPGNSDILASLHAAAAHALTCLTLKIAPTGFAFREALRPSRLHEAQWHLRQAERLAPGGDFRSVRERLTRIGGEVGWTRLHDAVVDSNEDGEEILSAIVQRLDEAELVHPLEPLWAAELAGRLLVRGGLPSSKADSYIESLLARAFEASAQQGSDASGGDTVRFCLHSTRASLLLTQRPDDFHAATSDVEEALRMQPHAVDVVSRDWFENAGDIERDHALAAWRYREGLFNPRFAETGRPSISLVLKYLGACELGRRTIDPPLLLELRRDSRLRALATRRRAPPRPRCQVPHVLRRAEQGLLVLDRVLGRLALGSLA